VIVEDAIGSEYEIVTEPAELAKLLFEGAVDAYCPKCRCKSVFRIKGPTYSSDREKAAAELPKYGVIVVTASCQRDSTVLVGHSCREEMYVCFRRSDDKIIKIGQFPSRAALDFGTLDAAFGELDDEFREELGRAIGLRAHGIGIGSFVYLRRIFEELLEQAHLQARTEPGWSEDTYTKARVAERITLLQRYLPPRLVQAVSLYGILSKGIHELTEAECLDLFDPVMQAIHYILSERREKKEFEKTIRQLNQKRAEHQGVDRTTAVQR